MDWKIPLAAPDLDDGDIEAVTDVVRSGWLTMGPRVAEFERLWCEKTGVKYARAVSSGTAALHLAFLALGLGPGDEVICPALSYVATANAARYVGAEITFADAISAHDLTIDPDDVEAKITAKTRAIIVMHFGGYMCHMDRIQAIARKHDLYIVEDAAHAPLAVWKNADGTARMAGAIGDCGAFSFYGNKNMTTGEGGMVTTNSGELADKIKLLRSHGMTSATYDRHRGQSAGYDVIATGYNYRMDDIRAALGINQLKKLEENTNRRRLITAWYREALGGNSNIIIPFADRDLNDSACHLMVIVTQNDPQAIRERLTEAGIQTSQHYTLIPDFKDFDGASFKPKDRLLNNSMTLPLYPQMTKEQVNAIAGIINEIPHL